MAFDDLTRRLRKRAEELAVGACRRAPAGARSNRWWHLRKKLPDLEDEIRRMARRMDMDLKPDRVRVNAETLAAGETIRITGEARG